MKRNILLVMLLFFAAVRSFAVIAVKPVAADRLRPALQARPGVAAAGRTL